MVKNIIGFVLIVLFLTGCGGPELTIRSYEKFSKDEVLNAAKKVFVLADKENFLIDSYRNELNVTRFKAAHYGYEMDIVNDNFYIKAFKDHNKTTVELSITRSYGADKEDTKFLSRGAHNLFWDRLEYILGIQSSWTSCTEHRLTLGFDSSLCDFLDIGNKLPSSSDILQKSNVVVDTTQEKDKEIVAIKTSSPIEANTTATIAELDMEILDIADIVEANASKTIETNSSANDANTSFVTTAEEKELMKNEVDISLDETKPAEAAPIDDLQLAEDIIPLDGGFIEGTETEGGSIDFTIQKDETPQEDKSVGSKALEPTIEH